MKIEHKRKKIKKVKIWAVWFGMFITLCSICYLCPLLNVFINHAIWKLQNIDSYTITIEDYSPVSWGKIILTIENNRVIDFEYNGRSSSDIPEDYTQFNIDYWFQQALECKLHPIGAIFCDVKYNSSYRFPSRIVSGTIHATGHLIYDFYPIGNDN